MYTRVVDVPTTPKRLTDIVGPLPTTGFGELLIVSKSTNTDSFYIGDHSNQPIEIPAVAGLSYSLEKEDPRQVYIVGTDGDEFIINGIRK